MLERILDLHIHSKYSRACSSDLELPNIARACEIRGIDIVATGDFTHPLWFKHIQESLVECEEGIYRIKKYVKEAGSGKPETKFIIGTELSCIKKHKGATRRVHHCV